MTLFSYEIFDAVARQGSFNKAAQQLHLTPSAISHAIAVMEAELWLYLIQSRQKRRDHDQLRRFALPVHPGGAQQRRGPAAEHRPPQRPGKGKVKLGAFNSVCAGLLPQILKSFMASYPQIEVEVYQVLTTT